MTLRQKLSFLILSWAIAFSSHGWSEFGIFEAIAQELVWESANGPYGGSITALYAAPNGTLYVATANGGVFRSTNGGESWTVIGTDFVGISHAFVIIGNTLYLAIFGYNPEVKGVYRSIDEGGVWTSVNTGLTNLNIRSLIVYGSSLYAGTADGVFRSEDGGNSWMFAGLKGEQVEAFLLVDSALYAGTDHGVFRAPLEMLPPTSRLFILSPKPNEVISQGTDPLLAVHIENHKGRWQWRLDTPFPDSGPAGGILGPLDNKIILTGLKPGRMYTLYVTLVDDQGNMLSPPVIALLPFSIAIASETPGRSLRDTKIAFVSERDGNKEIYIMNADGSNQLNLTRHPASDHSPVWSPDGIKIAFISNRDGSDDLFVMNSDGSNLRKLTGDLGDERQAKWSPDGTKIAFLFRDKGRYLDEIQVIDVDGANRTHLGEGRFSWSPKDSKLAFVSGNVETQGLYLIEADGLNKALLTQTSGGSFGNSISYTTPIWFPDGTKLLFSEEWRSPHGWLNGWNVFIINSDGSEKRSLGLGAATPLDFSPDGTKILFTTVSGGPGFDSTQLFMTDADGSNKKVLGITSPTLLYPLNPSWSPDGTKIAVQITQAGKTDLYLVNADGTERIRLTDKGDSQPAWQPFPDQALPPLPRIHAQPQKTRLLQNFPNPFNAETWLPFELSESSEVRIRIYNLRGEILKTIDLGYQKSGYYISRGAAAHWDGRNAFGESVASGLYFYELQAGAGARARRSIRRMAIQR